MHNLLSDKSEQTDLISRNNAAPKCDISETLATCGLSLQVEIGDGARWWDGVERHVHNTSHSSRRRFPTDPSNGRFAVRPTYLLLFPSRNPLIAH
jgi:hypothetical protein